ncbi:Pheromone-regulated membrane protein 10 [Tolypocladium capitatum]|uniref:Pheromone-regulated membrane protein 10 n=1 Tax=Tolypocladium capitatum TaxID=45235 RepID=A0A2K3QCP8_9HYPO|nr:Pheromone-regulated membrane protein 10 [Tolypocladium capitatum]
MAGEPTNDSGQASDVPTPNHRPKKRVVWHSSSNGGGGGGAGSMSRDRAIVDYAFADRSPLTPASPRLSSGLTSPGSLDAQELRLALTKVLSDEQEQQQRRLQQPPVMSEPPAAAGTPRTPRPALRRNTSYGAPEERERADWAEQRASQRQLRSMTDARRRAHRLAMSVGSHSAPGSRRSSCELHASFPPLKDDSDSLDPRRVGLRTPRALKDHGRDLFHRAQRSSGTNTPVQRRAYTHDYVPGPSKYRGGVLSSLLKLYGHDRGAGTNSSSGYNTPLTSSATLMSPRSSPPPSRPASSVGSAQTRVGGGLLGSLRSRHSTTSLTELVKSSSMFAAPGASKIHDQWAEKLRRERLPKPKKERIRITVHIAGIISRHRYLLKLCRALMLYGAPTHRLEEYMAMSSRVLEIDGQFLYMPSCMIISFDDSATHTAEVKVVREPQGVDLGKLRDVHNIYKEVVHDKLGVDEATRRLDEVMRREEKFRTWIRVPMYGIASACVAPFAFEGRFIDLPVAFMLGCVVGLLQLVFAPGNELYAHVFEVSAAVITSFLARAFGSLHNGQLFCFSTLAQSSIALILPGYMVLCSSLELQSHNIVAGSVRMVYAVIYTLFLGYGITIGASLYGMMDNHATSEVHCQQPLDSAWYLLFVPGFTLCLCIINQAKWRQMPVMTAMAMAGFCVTSYTSKVFEGNNQISNMLGALAVGILANLYSRLGRHAESLWLDVVEWWELRMRPRFTRRKRPTSNTWSLPSTSDPESRPVSPEKPHGQPRKVGYSLAAAAMLPAIFVQVPSGLAAGGSLLAGINSANALTGNNTSDGAKAMGNLDGTAFTVLFSVIQVAIGISVGLFLSALIVYPLGKRRSGLFSF